jgi:flagellar hook-basal body complex protein FliE
MNVDPIGFIPPAQDIALTAGLDGGEAAATGRGDFASWIAREIGSVNGKIAGAETSLQRLATGDVDNLHQVMVSLEEAKLSFQLLVQVRNKLLEAYQDIMRMSI